jgi:DNA invertase Pin-like site-specific DNA recombinase
MAQMASVFAELERAMIRERTRTALGVKRSRNERISRHAPFGWDFGTAGSLVENTREQEVIRYMQGLRAQGKSYREIAARLDREGIPTKQGGPWQHTAVKGILARTTRAAG